MSDEHDPRYPLPERKHNPDPERYAREHEVIALQKEVERLEAELASLRAQEGDRLETLQARVGQLESRLTLSKGVGIGVFGAIGLVSFLVVDTVKDVLDHVYQFVSHDDPP